jgi:ATP-binding cassette subfamily B protein
LKRRQVWFRLWREIRGYRWAAGLLLFLELLGVPLALLAPLPLAFAVDSAINNEPVPSWLDAFLPPAATSSPTAIAVTAALLTVLIALVNHIRGVAKWLLSVWTGEQLMLRLRTRMFGHAQRMSLAYHDSQGTSDSTYRIQYDASSIQHLATEAVTPVITAVLTLVGMIYVTSRIDGVLALAALGVIPVLVFTARAYQHRLRDRWMEVKGAESTTMAIVNEALGALRVVKAFGAEYREERRYETFARTTMKNQVRVAILESSMWFVIGMALTLASAAVLYLGVVRVNSGALTLGAMLVAIAYVASITGPLETLASHSGDLQGSLAGAERAFTLLDEPHEVVERRHALRLDRAIGTIEFDHVTFTYPSTGGGLRDVTFRIEAGARVGVSGVTGSGKSTMISLLCRYYDVDDGSIRIDGIDIRDYKLADLRNQFAVVLQEPLLFSTTIAENIRYAKPSASGVAIQAAAAAADADEFIQRLPNGYDTVIGERGFTLSGGQRQRISIARAFLKDAPIAILDEPTSSVDVVTEARIIRAIDHLVDGRTTFLISHRQRMLDACDLILDVTVGVVTRRATNAGLTSAAVGSEPLMPRIEHG